jgi:hypothetical protein
VETRHPDDDKAPTIDPRDCPARVETLAIRAAPLWAQRLLGRIVLGGRHVPEREAAG